MNKKCVKPLLPSVTKEELLAFEPGKPETYTKSLFVNQVLLAMREICPSTAVRLGKHFGVDHKKLAGAIEMLTGQPFQEFREMITHHWYKQLQEAHPDWNGDQLARAVGYAGRTSFWHTTHRDRSRARYLKIKAYCERCRKMTKEEQEEEYSLTRVLVKAMQEKSNLSEALRQYKEYERTHNQEDSKKTEKDLTN